MRAAIVACAAGLVETAPGCGGDCNAQLVTFIEVYATVHVAVAEFADASAMLCRNFVCATGTLDDEGTSGELMGLTFDSGVTARDAGSGYTWVAFQYNAGGDNTPPANGDFYQASVTGSDGFGILSAARVAVGVETAPQICGGDGVVYEMTLDLD